MFASFLQEIKTENRAPKGTRQNSSHNVLIACLQRAANRKAAQMALMTVIKARKPKQIAKVFSTDDVGNLIKQVAAQLVEGEARVVEVNAALDLKNLLQLVTARSDLVLMPGAICGAVQGDTIQLITERLLAHKLGVSVDNVPGGVVDIDGVKYAARVKRGVTPPKWVLLDADNPEGMPPEQMGWDIQTRLEYLEPLIPGFSTCERV